MTDFDDNHDSDFDEELPKSKSQIKREMTALQDLGNQLVELSDSQLSQLPLDDKLLKAIVEARQMKHREGRRRQLQFIGKLMRKADHEAIAAGYQKFAEKDRHAVQRQHQVERWRDRMLAEGDAAVSEFLQTYPDTDRQQLRQLVRSALKEQQQNKPPAHARKLFRFIRDLLADT